METESNIPEKQASTEKKEDHPFYDIARRILLAGIGAIALTHDEIEEFIDKLVERGEIAKKDRENLINEIREKRRKHFHEEENHFNKKMEDVFEHFHVPTKKDFDELNEKLSALENKLDNLTKKKA